MARIQPIRASEWNDDILDALGAFPAGLNFVLSACKSGDENPRGEHLLGLLSQHPALAKAFLGFNAYIATRCSLPPRTRELVILRISWLQQSTYEVAHHLILARRAGLSDQELTLIQSFFYEGNWSSEDEAVLRAVDELHLHSRIADATWSQLRQTLDTQQLLDLLFLTGCYSTLAMVVNSTALPLEAGFDLDALRALARPSAAPSPQSTSGKGASGASPLEKLG